MTRRTKYNARKCRRHGRVFDSIAEADRATELLELERRGKIFDLQFQVLFVLVPAFTGTDGKRERAVTYTADFVYGDGEFVIVEDVKGMKTRDYVIRRKLLKRQFAERQDAKFVFRETK